jgi:glutathione S-transferase
VLDRTPAYLAINPRGQVPALGVDGSVITETAAVLVYLGRRYLGGGLLPRTPVEEAQCLARRSALGRLSAGLHHR